MMYKSQDALSVLIFQGACVVEFQDHHGEGLRSSCGKTISLCNRKNRKVAVVLVLFNNINRKTTSNHSNNTIGKIRLLLWLLVLSRYWNVSKPIIFWPVVTVHLHRLPPIHWGFTRASGCPSTVRLRYFSGGPNGRILEAKPVEETQT